MADTYVILNDDYLESGYVDATYVGTDSDLYVEAGYIQDAIDGSADISVAASLSASGGLIQSGIATTSVSATLSVSADRTRSSSADLTAQSTTTVSAVKTATVQVTLSSSSTTTIDADVIRDGSANSNSAVSVLSASVKTVNAIVTQSSAFTSTVSAVATVSPGADISTNATLTSSAVATKVGVVDIQAFQTHPTLWQDDVTWDNPVGTIWGPMVEVNVVGIVRGDATLASNFTTTADGDITAVANIAPAASATVTVFGNFETQAQIDTISSAFSVDSSAQTQGDIVPNVIQASASLTASGIFQVEGRPFDIESAFSVAVDGDVIRDGVAINAGAFSVAVDYTRIRPGVADINAHPKTDLQSIVDLTDFYTVNGRLQFVSSGVWRRAITIQSDSDANIVDTTVVNTHIFRITVAPGIYVFGFEANTINEPLGFNDVYWYNITDGQEIIRQEYTDTGDDVEADAVSKTITFTQETTLEIRTTGVYANLNIGTIEPFVKQTTTNLVVNADIIGDAVTIVASAGTLSVEAVKVTEALVTSSAEFTLPRWVGGKLFGGIVDIQAFATTVSALTIYNIDPFRVYQVDSESRLLEIVEETRILTSKSENRLNSIQPETRQFKVPSETRLLDVQPLELVELAGIKDRRTG